MRQLITATVVAGALLGSAAAQTPSPDQKNTPPSSIQLESPGFAADNRDAAKLTPGANSFAEGQARALLESKGFKNVSALMNDRTGIWRGTAMQGNDKVDVSVDFQGKVAATPHDDAKSDGAKIQEAK